MAGARQNPLCSCSSAIAELWLAKRILPLRFKSRSTRLLGCKRPRDGSWSLPTLTGNGSTPFKDKKRQPTSYEADCLFWCRWRELVRILYARAVPLSQNFGSLKEFFLSASSLARLACSVVNVLATARGRYQLSRAMVRLPSKIKKDNLLLTKQIVFFGADGGSRTRTVLPPTDFESVTSANSITSADSIIL